MSNGRELDWFVCPRCKQFLHPRALRRHSGRITSGRLLCAKCEQIYPIIAGIPSMLLEPHPYPENFLPPEDLFPQVRARQVRCSYPNGLEAVLHKHGKERFLAALREQTPAGSFDLSSLRGSTARRKARFLSSEEFVSQMLKDRIEPHWWIDERCQTMLAAVQMLRPPSLLDIATGGGGFISCALSSLPSTHAVGLEITLDNCGMVDKEAELLAFADRLRMVQGDARMMPIPDATFDCVSGLLAAYHISRYELAIAECARVLKPGGHFVAAFHTTYPNHAEGILTRAEEEEFIRWAHLPLNIAQVRDVVESASLTVSGMQEVGGSHVLIAAKR